MDDFGAQGEFPVHPELLDWLATEFMESGWDVKALQKTIVMSRHVPAVVAGHGGAAAEGSGQPFAGARSAIPAGAGGDSRSGAGGFGTAGGEGGRAFGEAVPAAGLWQELGGGSGYKQDSGEGLYRRSLYTYWKRTVAPPFMVNFDSPNREQCSVFENRTNSPLQALDLMNDVTFLEAARKLAERMMTEGGTSPEERVSYGYRLVLARAPDAPRRQVLLEGAGRICGRLPQRRGRGARVPQAGRIGGAAGARRAGTGGVREPGSLILNLDETMRNRTGVSMIEAGMTRRHFFGVNSTGVGLAALAGLWGARARRAAAHGGLSGSAAFPAERPSA